MSLSEWLKNGWLIEHKTSRQEINHVGAVTAIELDEISVLAGNLRKSVESWIAAKYPGLRP